MSEALPLFSAYLFATIPHVTRLVLLTAADNAASRRLAQKCGYVQEGVLRQANFYRGRLVDWVL
jgi:ribosomal-protein-alanine N-acetyltransferase